MFTITRDIQGSRSNFRMSLEAIFKYSEEYKDTAKERCDINKKPLQDYFAKICGFTKKMGSPRTYVYSCDKKGTYKEVRISSFPELLTINITAEARGKPILESELLNYIELNDFVLGNSKK